MRTVTPRYKTLVELARTRAEDQPARLAYAFLQDGEIEGPRLTNADLDAWARAIAVALAESGAGAEGGRALLLYPPGLEFIAAFFGCLYAGTIAVPAYPPDPARLNRSLPRLQGIARDARPAVILTTGAAIAAVQGACAAIPELAGARWIATDAVDLGRARSFQAPNVEGSDIAFLQYTSGSTAKPRGVMVGHANILSNTESMRIAFDLSEDDVSVTWLPNFHDLGLIEGLLMPLYTGHPCHILAPAAFVKRPARWLEAVTRYRATHTGCPNFGYELSARKVTGEEKSRLDLRSLRSAYNGAEPIRPDTPARFYEAFAGAGLRPDVMFLCYGLAEATLMVSGGPVGSAPALRKVKTSAFEKNRIEPAEGAEGSRFVIGSGRLLPGNHVVIVDPDTGAPSAPDTVGEIWVGGPLVAQGYWERPEETEATFRAHVAGSGEGPFLRTGDLGFLEGEQLFCTGRIKDLLILDGTNHYPQDIEVVVEGSHPAIRQGCSAAFSIDEGEGERLVVVAEIDPRYAKEGGLRDDEAIFAAVRGALSEREELAAHAIVLLAPGTVFKTSSGKIQRRACKAAYLQGGLEVITQWERPKAAAAAESGPAMAGAGRSAGRSEREDAIRAFLKERLAARIGVAVEQVDPRSPFSRHGLSSRQGVELAGEIEAWIGRTLSSTIVWEKPTINKLARHLAALERGEVDAETDTEKGAEAGAGAETGAGAPIAVIGIGCRFPGARGPAAFWRLLRDGVDAIATVPADRWDIGAFYDPDIHRPGKMNTKWGGFLDGVDRFDARFFGIAPREAASMDPQQRLALEVTWEALEDAGISAERAAGAKAAVFIGSSTFEYGAEQLGRFSQLDGYAGTGSALNIIANRISYFLDLHGPSVVVDTACSSSLVAVHLACQSLRTGESEIAIAGGVNLILSPASTINASKMGNLASDGRCKTFDARADGAVRSEGVGVVILKPLARAIADGDRVYAVIRGTCVNQDGRSNGLMAPNPEAQEQVLREAYRRAGILPGQVFYVEAHGTGTLLGDPIESKALGAVMGEGRAPGELCVVGSVKTNIGHTEAAAGIAGLIKVSLSLWNGEVPRSLHFEKPNPHIPFDALRLRVAAERAPWPDGPRYAGVSSFGWGGTNAHAVLEGAPLTAPPALAAASIAARPLPDAGSSEAARLLVLSAKSPAALRAVAASYKEELAEPGREALLDDIAYSAAARRSHLEHRLAIVGRTRAEVSERLGAFLEGEARPNCTSGSSEGARPKIVLVCPGNGSQRVGMGRELLAAEPVFREMVERCDAIVRPLAGGFSVMGALAGDDEAWLARNDLVQPAIVTLELALAALFGSWGVHPDAVVGHSLGEIAAACLAGALTLEDALRVTCVRSALLLRLRGRGGMALTELSLDEAREITKDYAGRLTIGASNGPASTVLSGAMDALDEVLAGLERRGVFCRKIKADGAGHSPMVDPLCPELLEAIGDLAAKPAALPFYSTVTGSKLNDELLGAAYWARNMRETVLFSTAIERLAEDGHETFIELSAHPILLSGVEQVARRAGRRALSLPSLKRGEDERGVMLGALGALYTAGRSVALEAVYPKESAFVSLPLYPFESERFWLDPEGSAFAQEGRGAAGRAGRAAKSHPLIREHIASAVHMGAHLFGIEVSLAAMPMLGDHRLRGEIVLPAAVYVFLVQAAIGEAFGAVQVTLEGVTFSQALIVPEESAVLAQLVIERSRPDAASFRFFSAQGDGPDGPWSLHCSGVASLRSDASETGRTISIDEVTARCKQASPSAAIYEQFEARGMEYGPSFRRIERAMRGDGEALARLVPEALPGAEPERAAPETLLDGAMQALAVALNEDGRGAYFPVGMERVAWGAEPSAAVYGHAVLRRGAREGDRLVGDIELIDEAGRVVLAVEGLRVERARAREERGAAAIASSFYEIAFRRAQALTTKPGATPGRWLIFADRGGLGASIARALDALGVPCAFVDHGAEGYRRVDANKYQIDPESPDDFRALLADLGSGGPPVSRIVHLIGLDAPPADAGGLGALREAERLCCVSALHNTKAVVAAGFRDPPRVFFVTRGAQLVSGGGVAPAQAPLWGVAKVAAYEHPELRFTCVDLDPTGFEGELDALLGELRSDEREDGIALRKDGRYVERLAPLSPSAKTAADAANDAGADKDVAALPRDRAAAFRVQIERPGVLDNLRIREVPKERPGEGQVALDVRAVGLNFRDVLKALGVDLGIAPGQGLAFGDECSGVISSVGPGVTHLRPGDEVIAIAPSSLGSAVVAEARLVLQKPARLSFEEAATLPIAFLTASYALRRLGRLAPGESVLIHAAAGGVGLAAVRIAQRVGARVFATAGSPEKVAALRAMGVEHVMSSRSLAFADEIERLTGGRGVDMVLNSLAGDFIPKSLSILAPCGRFLEIGRRDIAQNSPLGMGWLKKNVAVIGVDLFEALFGASRALGESLIEELSRELQDGGVEPLPRTVFSMGDAEAAFRYMAEAKHIGKVVLALRPEERAAIAPPRDASVLDPEGTYLIVGGLGGLGLETAKWLVQRGAQSLVLVGRSGASDAANEVVSRLRSAGAEVLVERADMAREDDARRVIEGVARRGRPLRGVIHAAVQMADATILRATREQTRRVMASKVDIAWNLHAATRGAPLDMFVLFSSAAALLGSPGQAVYAAANAFLDALARKRRAEGLPALSVGFGTWAEAGGATGEDKAGRLALRGLEGLSTEEGLAALERLLGSGEAHAGVMRLDLRRWRQSYPQIADRLLLSELDAQSAAEGAASRENSARAAILEAPGPAARRAALEAHLRREIGRVLRLAPDSIGATTSFGTLGFDSLMALELRNRLEASLGCRLAATLVWAHPTLNALVDHIAQKLGVSVEAEVTPPAAPPAAPPPPPVDAPSVAVEALSDEQADALMAEKLAALERRFWG